MADPETPLPENHKPTKVDQSPDRSPTEPLASDVERRSWEEFREAGLLWMANTILHWFGWGIVVVTDDSDPDTVIGAYPVRTKWRGFSPESNERGIKRLTAWLAAAGGALEQDIADDGGEGDEDLVATVRAEDLQVGDVLVRARDGGAAFSLGAMGEQPRPLGEVIELNGTGRKISGVVVVRYVAPGGFTASIFYVFGSTPIVIRKRAADGG